MSYTVIVSGRNAGKSYVTLDLIKRVFESGKDVVTIIGVNEIVHLRSYEEAFNYIIKGVKPTKK